MNVNWYGVEDALLEHGTAVHVGVRRGGSSGVSKGEIITVGTTKARVVSVRYEMAWDALPMSWRQRFPGEPPDPASIATYGLYAANLLRTLE